MKAKPRLTATVLFGLRSVFESCNLSHFRELYEGQPEEDQAAQLAAYAWLIKMAAYREERNLPCRPVPWHSGRSAGKSSPRP